MALLIVWLWRWAPVVAQMAAIFFASSQSDLPDLPGGLSGYSGHFIAYGILSVLAVRGFAGAAWRGVTRAAGGRALLLCAAYGVTDEWHQSLVPNRYPDPLDWVADLLGAIAGVVAVFVVARARRAAASRTRDV